MSLLKPVLYYTPRSPPCRAVMLTAAAIGLELDLRLMNLKEKEHMQPEFLKINPLHTIPVLDDNGVVVTDSHVICAYIADKYGKDDSLYPKAPELRRAVDARLFFECGHLFPRIRLIAEPVLYFGATEISPDKVVYMQLAYDGLEHCLQNSPFLCGDHLTIADLSNIASVSTAMLLAPIDKEKFPKVSAWVERLSALPYYNKTNKEGADLLAETVKNGLIANQKAKQN